MMVEMWVTTSGFIICLGLIGGFFIYSVKSGLNLEDSKRIDPIPPEDEQ